jgi:hypothetical protein
MTDLQIPREAVDKAARALLQHDLGADKFDDIAPKWQENLREHAMSALNAAAPLIVAAELDRIAATFDPVTDPASDAWMRAEKCGQRDVTRELIARAKELRGEA